MNYQSHLLAIDRIIGAAFVIGGDDENASFLPSPSHDTVSVPNERMEQTVAEGSFPYAFEDCHSQDLTFQSLEELREHLVEQTRSMSSTERTKLWDERIALTKDLTKQDLNRLVKIAIYEYLPETHHSAALLIAEAVQKAESSDATLFNAAATIAGAILDADNIEERDREVARRILNRWRVKAVSSGIARGSSIRQRSAFELH